MLSHHSFGLVTKGSYRSWRMDWSQCISAAVFKRDLYFDSFTSNGLLLFAAPTDHIGSMTDTIGPNTMSIISITSPVSIIEPLKRVI